MKCQFCHNPATIHLTDIIQGHKREMHLCDRCARERKLLPAPGGAPLNLKALLQLLLQAVRNKEGGAEGAACPHCGQSYERLKVEGRLGCAADYVQFQTMLEPLLERIHRATQHRGKRPRWAQRHNELQQLRQQLQQAVATEDYELAARLRDRIRQMERDVEGTWR
ncbi:MAG: UvrB/UvrC motif-containing protein [Gemmataceae bacterium]|nr:UvrB/UvrC motif-containing protein [Gemmataceae bacterium]MCS7270362.1 UvrB/UvrC motif-containing protein [Gemmataceae bacterium]